MRALRKLAVLGFAVFLLVSAFDSATRAQEQPACPDLVAKALELTGERCTDLGRDEVCYGNINLILDPREGIEEASIQFEQPGDRVELASVSSLKLGPLDTAADEWGVAYMRMRANLPDVAGGQFVTMLMFGDTEIRDASEELSRTSGVEYAPMQAFYFRTGVGGGQGGIVDACRNLPTNGVLIQTPKGAGEVQLVANEVNLTFGSTVLLEAPGQPETLGNLQTPTGFENEDFVPPEMVITTFEGQALVGVLGQSQIVGPGQQLLIPLDPDSRPFGPLGTPQYVNPNQYLGLGNFIAGAGDQNLIEQRDPDPTVTPEPSATPTPTRVPATRVPATAAPTSTFTPAPPPPPAPTAVPTTIFAIAGNGQSVPAGGTSGQLGAKVVDANGNPVGYVTVHFEITTVEGPGAQFSATGGQSENVITQADGIAYSSPLLVDSSTGVIEVRANETYFGFATTFTINVVSGPPTSVGVLFGDGQAAPVGSGFQEPLAVLVLDAIGNGVPGVVVNFSAPGSGPSGTFAGSGTNTISVVTDSGGAAITPAFTANFEAGQYSVTADVPGVGSATFGLVNLTGTPAAITLVSGSGQTTTAGAGYTASLRASVQDAYGNLASGAAVTFSAPGSGPSAVFSGSGGNVITVLADGSGVADSGGLAANAVAGAFSVSVNSGAAPAASFFLSSSPGSVAALTVDSGDNQGAAIFTGFGAPLVVTARDSFGNAVPNAPVTFTAPASGASAIFAASGSSVFSTTANSAGQASSGSLSANGTQGAYNVTVTSGPAVATLSLNNQPPPPIVTNLNDGGPGSLRYVVANVPAGSTITFAVTGTITLTGGEIVIDKNLTINGPGAGAMILSGNNASRIFNITAGALSLSSVTLTNGLASAGGAVTVSGGAALNLSSATVSNSRAVGGGGLYSNSGGVINVFACSFSGNSATSDAGGGIQTNGPASITNSTFVGNSAGGGGGGISARTGTATITNSTFANNSAAFGGGIEAQNPQGGAVVLVNSIVSGNGSTNCNGSLNDGGGNLQFGDSTCGGFTTANPNFGGLAGNPAFLPINAPSAAENLGAANCPAGDQRGQPRGTPCDAGAFEIP